MRHQLSDLLRTRRAMIAAIVVLALFIVAPAAWSRTGMILQVATPQVSVVAADDAAAEAGADTGTFTISRTGDTSSQLAINLSTGGTAANGSDYTSLSTAVVLGASQASVTVVVVPIDDSTYEGDETATVTLTSGTGYTVGSSATASVTITDNDLPSVSVTTSDANAAEAGSNTGSFSITRTGTTTAALTVGYTLSGTAVNGTDYSALSSSVVIPAGQASVSVTVTPTNDGDSEPAETVILTATANALYTVGSPATATVTITDNDNDLATVKVAATDANAAEAGAATGTFTVTRSGDLAAAMTVNYTIGGSAVNGSDYGGLSGAVVIPAGANAATVVVAPVDDSIDEANETVVLNLAAGSGYRIGSSSSASITISDNDGTPSNPPANPPSNPGSNPSSAEKDQCKDGGWRSSGKFKNQGDCVSWFATGGKNKPAR